MLGGLGVVGVNGGLNWFSETSDPNVVKESIVNQFFDQLKYLLFSIFPSLD